MSSCNLMTILIIHTILITTSSINTQKLDKISSSWFFASYQWDWNSEISVADNAVTVSVLNTETMSSLINHQLQKHLNAVSGHI